MAIAIAWIGETESLHARWVIDIHDLPAGFSLFPGDSFKQPLPGRRAMTEADQTRMLRAAIASLQGGLLSILEFLELLAEQSSDPEKFKSYVQSIRESLNKLDDLSTMTQSTEEDQAE